MSNFSETLRIPVGISSCLMGEPVRFNGGHCRSKRCMTSLSEYFDFRPYCPEADAGLGTPRPAMRLTGQPEHPRLTQTQNPAKDLTDALQTSINQTLPSLCDLDGYLLMKNSPSCGLTRVKVYRDNGYPHALRTRGLFTHSLIQSYPQLPVEEEARLNDDRLLENFILRVYTHHRFRNDVLKQPCIKHLIAFHSTHKYLVMAHHQATYVAMGKLLSQTKGHNVNSLINEYFRLLMQALAIPASRKNHSNALYHILGYLKRSLNTTSKKDITTLIHRYREGQIPLIAPMTLLQHYVMQYGSEYIQQQRYFSPYPEALGLRNAI